MSSYIKKERHYFNWFAPYFGENLIIIEEREATETEVQNHLMELVTISPTTNEEAEEYI